MKLPSIKGVKSPIVRSGNSNKSGVVPTAERRAAAQKRLDAMNPETRKKLAQNVSRSKFKAFTKDVLNRYGFDTSKKSDKTRSSSSSYGSNLSDNGSVSLPSLDTPTRVSNDNNPTVSSLEKQFKIVANQLRLLESISKRQQDNKVLEVLNRNNKSQESILEQNNAAELQNNQDLGSQIEPLNDQLVALSNSISSLIDILEDKQDEAKTDNGQQSFWEDIKDRYLGEDRKSKRVRQSRAAGSTANKELKAVERIAANDNQLASMSRRGRVADVIGKGLRKGEQLATKLGGSTTKAIEKLALPIIEKGLGKTVLKSIPIVGAVAGVGFAVDRLLHGDVVGAGLDAVSGLGGPLTAIPALIASTARDIYSAVYGVQPEEDPNASERMSEVTSVVKGVVTKTLTASIDQKPPVKKDSATDGVKGNAKKVLDNAGFGGGGSFGGAGATGDFSKDGGGGGGGAVVQTGKGPLKEGVQSNYTADDFASGTTTAENSGSQAQPKTESTSAPSTKAEKLSPDKGKNLNAQFSSGSRKDASTLIQKSEQTEEMATPKIYNISQVSTLPSPQNILTDKGKASIGNVPDPSYPLTGTLFNQLYFV